METFIIVVIVVVVMGVVGAILEAKEEVARHEESKVIIRKRLDALEGFKPDQTLVKIGAINKQLMGLSIDEEAKKICVIKGRSIQVVPFTSVLDVKLIVNMGAVTDTDFEDQAMRTMVGAMIGGGYGAVIGGLSSKTRTIQEVNNVSLQIVLSDFAYPVHLIEFVEKANAGASTIKRALKEAEQWGNILTVVIHKGGED